MDLKYVSDLADILNQKQMSAIEIEEDGGRIRVEKQLYSVQPTVGAVIENAFVTTPDQSQFEQESEVQMVESESQSTSVNKHTFSVESPMVGVFYTASSPEGSPFVSVGSQVQKGDTLCIIEAMKLMNEITADKDGEVVEILVKNGDVVDYGQEIFRLK